MNEVIEYKGFYIEFNFYGMNEYSVQYCGDDFVFKTVSEAKWFINSVLKKGGEQHEHLWCMEN